MIICAAVPRVATRKLARVHIASMKSSSLVVHVGSLPWVHSTHGLEGDQLGQVLLVLCQQVEPFPQQDAALLHDNQSEESKPSHFLSMFW